MVQHVMSSERIDMNHAIYAEGNPHEWERAFGHTGDFGLCACGRTYGDPLHTKPEAVIKEAASKFMIECGLEPTPDAIGQLTEAFLPCLRIMCERGYAPDGSTWRAEGWRGMLWKAYDKMERLWYHSWVNGRLHDDSVFDGINYLGFYWRSRVGGGDGWGKRGAPGNE